MKDTAFKVITSSTLVALCGLIDSGCSTKRGAAETPTYSNYGISENPKYLYTTSEQGSTAQGGAAPIRSGQETTTSGQETAQGGSQMVIPLYQENVVVGKREVDSGTVHIKKVVHTETVNQPVELRRETVSISRENAPAGSPTAQPQNQGQLFQEQEFTIQLHREEPVVQTQVTESGRIVAQKQDQPERTTVQRQVRREEIALDKGNAPDVHVSESVATGAASSPGAESRGTGSYSGAITDLATLSQATDASSISGRSIQLSNVKVQEVVDPTLIAVAGEGARMPIYVHLQQPVENLKPGDKINFTGTVAEPSKSPGLAAALSSSASQAVNAQPFFLEAQSAQLSKE